MSWKYRNKEVKSIPKGKVAFVYLLEYKDKKYIGYKKYKNIRCKKLTSAAQKRKHNTRKSKICKETEEWLDYYSSNSFFKGLSKTEKKKVKRTILHQCTSEPLAKYWEAYEILKRHALMPDSGYENGNLRIKCFSNIFNFNKK